jgi:hypothetical protein
MPGLVRFNSLAEAIRNGFQVCGQCPEGYLVRIRTERGWAMAIARVAEGEYDSILR